MATFDVRATVSEGPGVAPSYAVSVARYVYPTGQSIENLGHGAGNSHPGTTPDMATIYITSLQNQTNLFSNYIRPDIVLDMRDYSLVTITGATLYAYCYTNQFMETNIYATTDRIGLYRQRESIRGLNSALVNFYEIYYGASTYGPMSDTYHDWDTVLAGAWFSWPMNSDGITYLNSVNSKADMPGYAFLGLDLKNNVDNETNGTWDNFQYRASSFNSILLRVTYETTSPPAAMQFGPTTRVISGMQINVSGTWRYVTEMKINIGDVWKDVI